MRSASSIRLLSFLFLVLLGGVGLNGCSDDPSQPADNPTDTQQTGVLQARDLAAGGAGFEIETYADDPARPGRGRFGLRGSNLHYDADLGALVVDLTVVNRSQRAFPEPVTLTFLTLLPPGTTVLNADNDQTGPGAQIVFSFANDDGQWTPEETSTPRTVHFGVAQGVSIAFVGRIDVGTPPGGGAIGGIVWNDADRDGLMGPEEQGVAGAGVRLTGEGIDPRTAATHTDGTYRFDGLPAGAYTVRLLPADRFEPTTPAELMVLLTEFDGQISDFLAASFGVIRRPIDIPPRIEPGDRVDVTGVYVAPDPNDPVASIDGHKVVATTIVVRKHGRLDPLDDTMPPTDPPGPPGIFRYPGWLAGPVTDLDVQARRVQVMGTWIAFFGEDDSTNVPPLGDDGHDDDNDDDNDEDDPPGRGEELKLEDLQVGDRVLVRAVEIVCPVCAMIVAPIQGHGIFRWEGEAEKVVGRVMDVRAEEDPDGAQRLLHLTALGTVVEVNKDTTVRVVWIW